MDEVKRYVNLSFIFAGIIIAWLYVNFIGLMMGWFALPNFEIVGDNVRLSTIIGIVAAAITAFILWKNAKVYTWALNVANEMKKVTWPTGDETKYAMKVVVATSCIVAIILFLFDATSKWLTGLILGI